MEPVESRKRSPVAEPEAASGTSSQVRRRLSAAAPPDAFDSLLAIAGCSLKTAGAPVLDCDHRSVLQKLDRRFQVDASVLAKFLSGFQTFISNEGNLRRMLLPMLSSVENGNARSCDSLARLLLSVGQTQSSVAAGLLEKIPEYLGEVEADNALRLAALMDSIPRLILSQFRWLEFVVDSRTLTEKILEVLSICPLGLKKEIITLLPEVVVDADHEMVVQSLEEMLQDDLQLIVPVLDAFSNFNLEENLFEQAVAVALSSLRSADVEDLPLVVKFLVQSASASNATQIVQQLRGNLNFATISDVRATKPDLKMKGKSTSTSCETLVLEAVRSGLRFQNLILNATLKELRRIDGGKTHKVVDIWLLLIIHANGGPHRKVAESFLLNKITQGDVDESLLRQCIQGRGDSLQDYFQTLISISEMCLRSKVVAARQFGMRAYVLLFQEFAGHYYRQEVLGALISHTGSGNAHEIGSALETLLSLAKKHPHDLLPLASFINGLLDHLENFQDSHLHQVYQIFSDLAITAWSSGGPSSGSSVGSELLIIIRKQITNSEPKYRRMGIIGAVGLASCMSKSGSAAQGGNPQSEQTGRIAALSECFVSTGSHVEEIFSLLQMTLEACKSSPTFRGYFYDELASHVETARCGSPLLEWTSKHTSEFEPSFLGDLDSGELQTAHDFGVLEGELWMNLDDDMSPIVLNVLPLLMKEDLSGRRALIYLPANFRLLASAESVINQKSLGGIDALLGCPMLMPKHQFLIGETWSNLNSRQKELGCLALFYTANWIRELINAFSTQLEGANGPTLSQTIKDDTVAKLFKRLRNLMFVEHCLHQCLQSTSISFEPVHFSASLSHARSETRSPGAGPDSKRSLTKEKKKGSRKKNGADANGTQKAAENNLPGTSPRSQPTNIDGLSRPTVVENSMPATPAHVSQPENATCQTTKEESASGAGLDEQRWKLRPLTLSTMNILEECQVGEKSCCSDPLAQLPLTQYLLEDLLVKLDWCMQDPARKLAPWMSGPVLPKAPSGLGGMSGTALLTKLTPFYPCLRKHLDCSIAVLQSDNSQSQGPENQSCEDHWVNESLASGNPPDASFSLSAIEAAQALFLAMIRCFKKILSYPELTASGQSAVLKAFLKAFGNGERLDSDLVPPPVPGSMEEAFCNTYTYLDSLSDAASAASFTFATELVMVLKTLVDCGQAYTDKAKDDPRTARSSSDRSARVIPYLRLRLGLSAGRVLEQDWNAEDWKSKGDVLRHLLQWKIQNSDSPVELLEETISSAMTQVPSNGRKALHGLVPGYPALSSGTFLVWYRVEHEEVLALLHKLVKEFLAQTKLKVPVSDDLVTDLLCRAQQCISLHVLLVKLTKDHDKTPIHAVAMTFCAKFVDTFLKGIDFLRTNYAGHQESINRLLTELQKATRIVQTLCSEVKGRQRLQPTGKVPMVKRSMERYVYCIKALLHSTAHGSSFWMGNLKHKDLQGHEVSSQAYAADDDGEPLENQASDDEQQEEAADEDAS